jgi:hypothetical protein
MRFFWSAIVAVTALAVLIGATGGDVAEAARITLRGTATGAEENPPIVGGGSAQVTFVFDDVTNDLTYAVTVSGLSPDLVTASHIHRGARGVNGPIVHNLSTTGFTQISGTIRLSAADVADLRAGNFYVNVHSKANAGGFARWQMVTPGPAVARPAGAPGGPGGPGAPGGPGGPGARPIAPPRTGDAGLAATNSLAPIAGLIVFATGGLGVLAVARKRS